jgi:hypothetical protein
MKRFFLSGVWLVLCIVILLACAPALPAGEPNEAEKLFRAMEKKINSVKTIECRFEGKKQVNFDKGEFKGTLLLGEGNKCYLEGTMMSLPGLIEKGTTICDGTKMYVITDGKPAAVHDAPKDLNAQIRAALAQTGLRLQASVSINGTLHDLKQFLAPDRKSTEFRLGKKGKVGGKESHWIQYTLPGGVGSDIRVNLWLDAETDLPLKRTLNWSSLTSTIYITETYTDLILDGKIDAKKLELPKK